MKNHRRYTLTTDDVAAILGYNVQYVRQLAASGYLPAVKRRRQWFFDPRDVDNVYQRPSKPKLNSSNPRR